MHYPEPWCPELNRPAIVRGIMYFPASHCTATHCPALYFPARNLFIYFSGTSRRWRRGRSGRGWTTCARTRSSARATARRTRTNSKCSSTNAVLVLILVAVRVVWSFRAKFWKRSFGFRCGSCFGSPQIEPKWASRAKWAKSDGRQCNRKKNELKFLKVDINHVVLALVLGGFSFWF